MGAAGGSIFGIPVLTSASVPESDTSPQTASVILLDAAELIVADSDEIGLDVARSATVQMDTAPTDPANASNVMVNLWQQNLVGWRVIRPVNWKMRRAGAIATLTNVGY